MTPYTEKDCLGTWDRSIPSEEKRTALEWFDSLGRGREITILKPDGGQVAVYRERMDATTPITKEEFLKKWE